MSPKIIDKRARRQEILMAAMHVFSSKGFKNTKIIDIAKQAGIGKGTVYEYFRNKDEMLVAAFSTYQSEMDAAVENIRRTGDTPLAKIRAIVEIAFEIFAMDVNLMGIMFDFWLEGMHNKGLSQIDFRPIYAKYRAIFTELLKDAQHVGEVRKDLPAHTAAIIIGAIEGLFLQWMVEPRVFEIEDTVESVMNTLFYGLSSEVNR